MDVIRERLEEDVGTFAEMRLLLAGKTEDNQCSYCENLTCIGINDVDALELMMSMDGS